jgi:hypothetical protein
LLADYRPAVGAAIDRIRCGQTGAQAITALIEERSAIVAAFDLVNLARVCGKPLNVVADALGNLAAQIDLDWLGGAVNHLPAGNRWQARARAQLTATSRRCGSISWGRFSPAACRPPALRAPCSTRSRAMSRRTWPCSRRAWRRSGGCWSPDVAGERVSALMTLGDTASVAMSKLGRKPETQESKAAKPQAADCG